MAVADHGSITNAATELGISQPAVSRLLSDLGERLGFALFDRRKGQLVPSQEVRFLQPDIRRVLELMRQISDVSEEITNRRAGHIRIACLPGFATSHLPDVVAAFLQERPGLVADLEVARLRWNEASTRMPANQSLASAFASKALSACVRCLSFVNSRVPRLNNGSRVL